MNATRRGFATGLLASAAMGPLFAADAADAPELAASKKWFREAQYGDLCLIWFDIGATTNDSWGYKASDQNWKSAARIRAGREHLKSIGANYLLNVGPDGLGRIPAPCCDILRQAAPNGL